jgi:hypothetical protein
MDLGTLLAWCAMLLRCPGIPEFNLPSRILFRSKLMEECNESDGKREKCQRRALAGLEDLGGLTS